MVANAGMMEFSRQLGEGTIPIPREWQWVAPIIGAMLVAATMVLRSVTEQGPPSE